MTSEVPTRVTNAARAALVLSLCAIASSPSHTIPRFDRFVFTEVHLGTRRSISIRPGELHTRQAAGAAFSEIVRLEDLVSDYRPGSELSLLAAPAGGGPVPVGPELFELLSHAKPWAKTGARSTLPPGR